MISSDEIFMQMREEESFEQRMGIHDEYHQNEEMMEEINALHGNVPPIDIGLMVPSLQTSEQIANGIIQAVKEGQITPLELAVKKKCLVDALDMALKDKDVMKACIEEVEQYGKDGAKIFGATVKVTSTVKYDYSKDPKWQELNNSIAPVLAEIKEQEERIKVACKQQASLTDTETGEIIASIVPAPRTETVAVSFKKK